MPPVASCSASCCTLRFPQTMCLRDRSLTTLPPLQQNKIMCANVWFDGESYTLQMHQETGEGHSWLPALFNSQCQKAGRTFNASENNDNLKEAQSLRKERQTVPPQDPPETEVVPGSSPHGIEVVF
eukprot:1161352-Pelagomonas_calceolata.AAC.10